MVKAAFLVCVVALIQSIAAIPFSGLYAPGAYGPAAAAASHGGALPTSSASVIPASGVNIVSENEYQGPLSVSGALPFLGTVALEGALPTCGSGAVAFGAGNGDVAMLREDSPVDSYPGPYGPYGEVNGHAGHYHQALGAYNAAYARPYAPYPRRACGCGVRL